MNIKPKGAKAPLNRFYESMPFAFTTTGNSRAIKGRPRFTRNRMSEAIRTEHELAGSKNLIINNRETSFILSEQQTALILGSSGMIEEMVLNGWQIDAAPPIYVNHFTEYALIGGDE